MKLIVINGPCGVGKSTLARKIHADLQLSFLLDIDAQSLFISGYRDYREERWEMMLALSAAVINAMLPLGRTVIVDKMTYAPSVLDSYYDLAKKHGAEVREIMLWASKESVLQRAHERGWRPNGLLTPEKVEMFWDRLNDIKNGRTQATLIDTDTLDSEAVYKQVADLLS